MFNWLRKRHAVHAVPDDLWQDLLIRYPFLAARPVAQTLKLRELSAQFLATKEFYGANGMVITDPVALAIAAQAVLPVLNLGLAWYDDFVGIVVHPDEVIARRMVTDEHGVVHRYDEVVAGEAMDRGPVMLSWRDVQDAASHAEHGYNLVIHEFIHKIDMRDGKADGCPPLPSRAARDAWLAVMQAQYQAFREKVIIAERFGGEPTWLDSYGATAVDEFFAVACEAYFVNRKRFACDFEPLMPLLDGFFNAPGISGAAAS
jgi:Mlc titration factor MtfA (ptsG expression regulator)